MPTPEEIAAKIEELQDIASPRVAELVLVRWPEPDGPIYYGPKSAVGILDNQTLLDQLEGEQILELRFDGSFFLDIAQESGISDDKVTLDFYDGEEREDGEVTRRHEISRLFHTHGPGPKTEIYYYFPEPDLLLLQWWGHLQPPSDVTLDRFKTSAEFGFRSSSLPLPRRAFFSTCSALFGGLLETAAQVAANDCKYDRHLGGSFGNLNGGSPFTSCPRNNFAVCIERLEAGGTAAPSFLGFDTKIESYTVGQTKGPNLSVTTRGNNNNLKRPLRVIAGQRHVSDLDLLAFAIEPDTKHPEGGAVAVQYAICEGPINGQSGQTVNGVRVGYMHLNVRNGELRQSKTGFSKNVSNYSGTALFFARVQGDFTKTSADQLRAEVDVQGLRDIRVYTDESSFTEQYSTDRAWWLLRVQTDKRWGEGLDYSRVEIQDYIDLAAWYAESVTQLDRDGNSTPGVRSSFNAELIDRTAQQQIYDMCLAGRCSVPFPDLSGRERVKPLKGLSEEELAAAPLFIDYGEDRNILVENEVTTLRYSMQDDKTLCNRYVVSFDDEAQQNTQTPLPFESELQQLAAGRAFGDNTRRVVEKSINAFGVTSFGEAARLGNLLLNLGEFDEGGLANNLRVTFTTWYLHALTLLKYDVIRVRSSKLDFVNDLNEDAGRERFEYFRILSRRRLPDLKVEITAQAYSVDYYNFIESAEAPLIVPSAPELNAGGGFGRLPFDVDFDEVNHSFDRVTFKLMV